MVYGVSEMEYCCGDWCDSSGTWDEDILEVEKKDG